MPPGGCYKTPMDGAVGIDVSVSARGVYQERDAGHLLCVDCLKQLFRVVFNSAESLLSSLVDTRHLSALLYTDLDYGNVELFIYV